MGIVLRGPGIYVPPDVLTNKDLVELVDEQTGERVLDTSDEWIIKQSGIYERRISLDKDEKEMSILAIRNLQKRLGEKLKPGEVRFATNRHPDGQFPGYASDVAAELGVNVPILDESAGCTGLVYAIRDSYNAILAGDINSALVGGVDRLTDCADYGDRSTCFIFGDGAGLYLLEKRDDVEGIIAKVLGGIPDVERKLTSKEKLGKKIKKTKNGYVAFDAVDKYLIMDGPEVFRFAVKAMVESVLDVMDKSPYKLSDVDVIVPHGASKRITDTGDKKLRAKGFKGITFTNMMGYGNTSTASIPIAEVEAIEKGIIEEGSLVLLVGFGAGLTWGSILKRATLD